MNNWEMPAELREEVARKRKEMIEGQATNYRTRGAASRDADADAGAGADAQAPTATAVERRSSRPTDRE